MEKLTFVIYALVSSPDPRTFAAADVRSVAVMYVRGSGDETSLLPYNFHWRLFNMIVNS